MKIKEYIKVKDFGSSFSTYWTYKDPSEKPRSTYYWRSWLLRKMLSMEEGDIIPNLYSLELISTEIDIARCTVSIGKDEKGIYLSIFDVWYFKGDYNE